MTVLSKLKSFQCDQCSYKYKVKKREGNRRLFIHFLDCHSKLSAADKLCCDHCDFATLYRRSMWAHTCRMHRADEEMLEKVVCDECPNGDKYAKEKLIFHYICRHSPIDYIFNCAECEFTAKGKDNIIDHVWTRHLQATRPIICRQCGLQFDGRENTRLHMKTVHPRSLVCDVCGKRYPRSNRKGLTAHMANDHQAVAKTAAVCDNCDIQVQGLFLSEELWRHIYQYHIGQNARDQPACDHCGMRISRGRMFEHNLAQHWNMAPSYQCDKCPWKTKSRGSLLAHITQCHLKQRRMPCDMCDGVYSNSNSLFQHKKKVHQQVRVVCNPCGKVFVSKLNLRHHLKKHV